MWNRIIGLSKCFVRTARMMVGMPDYDLYRRRVEACHPGCTPMSYGEFFRERQEARFGGRGRVSRCC